MTLRDDRSNVDQLESVVPRYFITSSKTRIGEETFYRRALFARESATMCNEHF
jgi:hypothetical protein